MRHIDRYMQRIAAQIDGFKAKHGMSKSMFGLLSVSDDKIEGRIRAGLVTVRTLQRVEDFIRSYNTKKVRK